MSALALPLVGVITPLYNNAAHLSECLDSILSQTYENWQCIIVNNRSTDASGDIAQRYVARDPRFRLHNNALFLPPIANHNNALRLLPASSKYCKIVFADDWIFPECLERMTSLAEQHPSVGIVSAYCLEGTRVTCTGLPYSSTVLSGRDVCRRHLLDGVFVFGSPNAVLYRGDLVRAKEPFYNEANIHADTEVCFDLLKNSDFGFVHQVLTYTRVREASLTAWSSDVQSWWTGWLPMLLAHGRDFLSPEELETRLGLHMTDYYRFLGKNLLLKRGPEFWNFHRARMTEAGVGFSRSRLALGLLATLRDLALNPQRTAERIRLRVRRRGRADST